MNREEIIQKLRARGCRITKQRLTILDIILEGDCSSCKEIHYKASKLDPGIGMATVYRMVNSLEEIGAITRKSIYLVEATVQGRSLVALQDRLGTEFNGTEHNISIEQKKKEKDFTEVVVKSFSL